MGQMNQSMKWNGGLQFEANIRDHKVVVDASANHGGKNAGPTPKELTLSGICGCTGMDVASILTKMREPVESFEILADATTTEGEPPSVFDKIHLVFKVKGQGVDPGKVLKAVDLSQTKYCGVSAMIARGGAKITYTIEVNGEKTAEGVCKF